MKEAADGRVGRGERKAATVKRNGRLGMFLLVAIPLPGTGAWTGALVAALLNVRVRNAFLIIFAGVCAAGVIVSAASLGLFKLF